jgi:predicted AAA+ superfamily ATPase
VKRSKLFNTIVQRMTEPRRFIQVLAGPRQTGKTTLARQAMAQCAISARRRVVAVEPVHRKDHWPRKDKLTE